MFFMPVIWRYLIAHYLKITLASILAFVAILLTMQLDDIVHFAALGAPIPYIFFFTLHQIPYILPIALPLSCLIGSLILIQRLSTTHELTALRASGFALHDILAPIWITAAFLTIINFWITSELATHSHLKNNLFKNELRAVNPLLLLNNKHLMRIRGFYFEALGPSHVGESSSDVVLALPNQHHGRLHLMIANHLKISPSEFIGEKVSLITAMANETDDDFDPLLIENIGINVMQVSDFSDILQRKVLTINNDYLQMSLLLARIKEINQQLKKAKLNQENVEKIRGLKTELNRSVSEIIKRLSIALAAFSFTLMGTNFAIHIGRKKHYTTLYLTILLTTGYLIAFFLAKRMDHHPWTAASLYLGPHLLIIFCSLIALKRVTKGIE